MRPSSSKRFTRLLLQLIITLIFLMPIAWMAAASLRPLGLALPQRLELIPTAVTLENFRRVLDLLPYGRFTVNSLVVVLVAVPITLLIASWAGLGMARLPKSIQKRWVLVSLAVLMVPGIALWSTRFVLYRQIGWIDTRWALIAPSLMGTSPFFVLMFYRAFRRIPSAIYDAARIDGAGILATWWLVALPTARPTMFAVALLSFVIYWGDYVSPLLYLQSESQYTLPIGLQLLQQMNRSDWPLLMAAAVLTMLIPVLLFLLAQPYFSRIGVKSSR